MDVETAIAELGAQIKPSTAKRAEKTLVKARTRDSMSAFSKLTETVDGRVRIVDQSPLIVPIAELAGEHGREEVFEGLHQLLRGRGQGRHTRSRASGENRGRCRRRHTGPAPAANLTAIRR